MIEESSRRGATRGRWRLALAVIAVALLAGVATPWFLDFDEAVYAEVAREMRSSGEWLHPTWNGKPFYEKPLLQYWLVAPLYGLLGLTPVAPRLLSAGATLALLWVLARFLQRRYSPAAAEAAVWVAGASLLPFSLGRLGLFDAPLVLATTVALLALHRGLADDTRPAAGRRPLLLGYAAAGLALATKGPVFPLLLAVIVLVDALAARRLGAALRRSGLLWGVPVLVAAGAPWWAPFLSREGTAFAGEFLGRHNLERLLVPLQGHGGSPLYYVAVLLVGLTPFAALVGAAVVGPALRNPSTRRLARFAAVWAAGVVVAFSLVATKLPHYVAPAVPAFALLVAVDTVRQEGRRGGAAWHATLVLGIVVAAGIAAAPTLLGRAAELFGERVLDLVPELAFVPPGPWPAIGFHAAALILVGGAVAGWFRVRSGARLAAVRTLGFTGAAAWAVLWVAFGVLADRASIQPLRRLSQLAAAELPAGEPIYLLELQHRVVPNLATGRRAEYLRADREAHVGRLAELVAGEHPIRAILPALSWLKLQTAIGATEIARDGPYVLIGPGRSGE